MGGDMTIAASGLLAQQRAIDTIANNIANVNTTGFRRVRVEPRDLPPAADPHVITPAGGQAWMGQGVDGIPSRRLFAPGSLQQTGRELDLALSGDAWFAVALPDGTRAYSRDGAFGIDGEGRLVTAGGYPVAPGLTLPADAEQVWVSATGTVMMQRTGSGTPEEAGQLEFARVTNPAGLLAVGQNLFTATVASGDPIPVAAGEAGIEVRSGFLEGSNVDLADEMTRMMGAQRAYQMNLKALQTMDDMNGEAVNLRR